tara:strand:+ start:732 stop:986 length:255 start_codon:yes stop_codon:yes gene_type:complete
MKTQWIKVTYRFADKKVRAERAAKYEKQYGKPHPNPDRFSTSVAFPIIDGVGFTGAFELAKEYIADDKRNHGNKFEYRIDGGEW